MTIAALWAARITLALSAVAGVVWWVVVGRQAPFPDWRVWPFLAGVGFIQTAAWIVVLVILLRIRRHPTFPLTLATFVLALASLFSHLLNGFTPALGGVAGLGVLLLALLGLIVTGRSGEVRVA